MFSKSRFWLFFCCFVHSHLSFSQRVDTAFSFSLQKASITSAGIYKTDGTLVRTLWNNVRCEAGRHPIKWDGTNDEGDTLPAALYQAKVISSEASFAWEGVIGNTSASHTGATKHRAFQFIQTMCFTGTTGYYGVNYNEGWPASYSFSLKNPQSRSAVLPVKGTGAFITHAATDGQLVYWAGEGLNSNFVYATVCATDAMYTFANGKEYHAEGLNKAYHAVNIITDGGGISGLAVQKNGPFLFVARKKSNSLTVLQKSSGQVVQKLTIPNVSELAVSDDNFLWMIYESGKVQKFIVKDNGSISPAGITLSGLVDPLALALSPDGKTVAVCDGGTIAQINAGRSSQQVKAFDAVKGGQPVWLLGKPGGYQNDPAVTNDKFYFTDRTGAQVRSYNPLKTFIAFQPDGSFWVGDAGNYRAQHYAANRTFIHSIMYMPHSYSVQVDRNNPTRVFNEYLEFAIDYSKPLKPDNGSWTLVRNWRAMVTAEYYQDFMVNILKSVITLKNNRTYAFLRSIVTHKNAVVELTAHGLRQTGLTLAAHGNEFIRQNGDLVRFTNGGPGGTANWQEQRLSGFNSNGDPLWLAPVTVASLHPVVGTDPFDYDGSIPGQMTASGVLISYDKGNANNKKGLGYHLGGLKNNQWLFRTAHNTHRNYRGDFPSNGAFDIGNTVQYPGGDVYVLDNFILQGYHGEFWKQSQTNKWNLFYHNGLLVGQFGVVSPDFKGTEAFAGGAGNVFSGGFVKVGSNYYLYHNDESIHGGVHRWKLSGLHTVQEQTVELPPSYKRTTEGSLPDVDLMAGLPFDTTLISGSNGWTRYPAKEDYSDNITRFWSVKTNVKTFSKRSSPDVWVKFANQSGQYTVSRDLGNHVYLSSWKLTGNISYDENVPNSGSALYLDLLDKQGKLLTRFFTTTTFGPASQTTVYANNIKIASGPSAMMESLTKRFQPLTVSMAGSVIKVQYAAFDPVAVSPYERGADPGLPKTMRLFFEAGPGNIYPKIIALSNMQFHILTSNALPLKITSVKASAKATGIQVNWYVENEKSVQQYIVERSANGQQFSALGKVQANNNNAAMVPYQWLDSNATAHKTYYRVKAIEKTGAVHFSQVVSVTAGNQQALVIFPNPITGNSFTLQLQNGVKGPFTLTLLRATGELVFQKESKLGGGSHVETISLPSQLPAGTYTLTVSSSNLFICKQLLIQSNK